jgi:A/G-specific adenine glycosylase
MKFIEIKHFTRQLIDWQKKQGRHHLPWQENRTAYRVWLSEVMLQQTQVTTVIERYQAFLKRFPTIMDLANASIDEVLAEWSGMGYYTRARNLHKCAQTVVSQFDGVFPKDPEELETLPGIGRSTAAAIAVFAYGESAAILDGNVKRVLARVWGIEDDLSKGAAVKELWTHAETLLPKTSDDLVTYTQGLMDFGATCCTQSNPACLQKVGMTCPFINSCLARKSNTIQKIPLKVKKVKVLKVDMNWWIVTHKGKVLLEKRAQQGIWAGLWSFPEDIDLPDGAEVFDLQPFKHLLTHRRLNIQPKRVLLKKKHSSVKDNFFWINFSELGNLGLPTPVKLLLKDLSLVHDDA